MSKQAIRCTVSNYVATVTMDRAPVNAVNQQFLDELTAVFDSFNDRDDVRAAVLIGEGKCFCAGADIKARAERSGEPGEGWQHSRRAREAFHSIVECQVPVVGAVNGPALGAGLALAASCDILIGSERAVLGLPEINVGLLGGGRHTMRLFGHSKGRRMMFTGERIGADELYRLGVIDAVYAPDALLDEATTLAADIASKSPIAMKLAKQAMNAIEFMSLRDGYRYEQNMTAELSHYEDSAEAMQAFVEKRDPVFTGR
ncbi:MAG: enoyl-CoA hydratase/isomerase family protein [Gammaproteobacteria bacterium]|nr:enoyl-CoA hydratase/isomerase family protein [Gammaproteobacteria bacterium]